VRCAGHSQVKGHAVPILEDDQVPSIANCGDGSGQSLGLPEDFGRSVVRGLRLFDLRNRFRIGRVASKTRGPASRWREAQGSEQGSR
jgi:hypothetical protein